MAKLLLLLILLVFSVSAGAQIIETLGEARVPVVHITPEQARTQAKEEALQRAVGEEVLTSESVLTGGGEQRLSSLSSVESRGGIVSVEMLEDRLVTTGSMPTYCVRLRAVVQPYTTRADPSFGVAVTGVRGVGYRSGEPLGFALTPTDGCYLNIFLFDDSGGGARLYPNAYEPERFFSGGETVTFPTNRAIQYTLELGQLQAAEEVNTLVVVQTRRRVTYTSPKVDYESVSEWVSRLEPAVRQIVTVPVRIVSDR